MSPSRPPNLTQSIEELRDLADELRAACEYARQNELERSAFVSFFDKPGERELKFNFLSNPQRLSLFDRRRRSRARYREQWTDIRGLSESPSDWLKWFRT